MSSKREIWNYLEKIRTEKGAVYVVLIDPDRQPGADLEDRVQAANTAGVDAIFVGGSLMMDSRCHDRVRRIKALSKVPVIFFPGGLHQLNDHYDAVLFLSFLSGRNPQYLIGEQVLAAPAIKDLGLEVIPTAYLLLDGGAASTVQFMSNTQPIPRHRPDITVAHALAAQFLGFRLVYLEAGSGAAHPVPVETIRRVADEVDLPIIVGGGIRTPAAARERVEAGAGLIVTGTIIEESGDHHLMKAFAEAVHIRE